VRFDELTLQRLGITTEALDLSEVFLRIRTSRQPAISSRPKRTGCRTTPAGQTFQKRSLATLAKLGVVLDDIMADYKMDCMALRCWIEIEKELGISPCVILSEMNDRGIVSAW